MKPRYLILAVAILGLTVFGFSQGWANEAYVMAADEFGNNHFMALNDNGTLSAQIQIANTGLTPFANGLGDFDNDGDFDYIAASGTMAGAIHLIEKLDSGNQFAPPVDVAVWSGAFFPGKMAVADFNGDGNLDFVLPYYYSEDAHLFLGNGSLEFGEPILLPGSTPFDSLAADAADFDNDGHFDFVSVPADYSYQIYINFGDGAGVFTPVKIDCFDYSLYRGIAAADFDGDGNVDLAATTMGAIDIYWGDGKRNFFYGGRINDGNIKDSPMDSYDVNGDGKQDLILGFYGDPDNSAVDVVAVLIGDGAGGFSASHILDGGDGIKRLAIAAPNPPKEIPNEDPVAVIEPSELHLKSGQVAEFTAAASYDPDGEIVGYRWDFGDAAPQAALALSNVSQNSDGVTASHVFQKSGDYTIILTVTDDKGATNSITAVAHVNEDPVAVIEPGELHLKPGQVAEFTAAASYDPDGKIAGYSWDFGDVAPQAALAVRSVSQNTDGVAASHVFQKPGDYTITLTVTDDKGATNSVTAVAHVTAPKIQARARLTPKTLNLNGSGRWVKAYIKLPKNYDGRQIDLGSLYLVDPESGQKITAASYGKYKKWWKIYVAKFDRQAVISHIGQPERRVNRVKLKIEGEVHHNDGPLGFEATAEIKACKPKPRKKHGRSLWESFLASCWKFRR